MEPYDPLLLSRRVSQALASGERASTLRSPLYRHSLHGVVRPTFVRHDEVVERVSDAVAVASGRHVIGGWAALLVQGNDWFDGRDRAGALRPVPVHCPPGGQVRRRAGAVEPWRGVLHPDEVVDLGGYLVADLARAAFDEMCRAPSVRAAVVVADLACSTTSGVSHTTVEAIDRVQRSHHKVRGIVQARSALALASSRSASPEETRTRLAAQLDADLTSLQVNVPLFDPFGRLIAVADLLDPETGLVIESDGAHHREAERHAADNVREERLEDHGLVVARVTHLDHRDRWDLAGRLRSAQRRAVALERPRTWTTTPPAWWSTWLPARRWQ